MCLQPRISRAIHCWTECVPSMSWRAFVISKVHRFAHRRLTFSHITKLLSEWMSATISENVGRRWIERSLAR